MEVCPRTHISRAARRGLGARLTVAGVDQWARLDLRNRLPMSTSPRPTARISAPMRTAVPMLKPAPVLANPVPVTVPVTVPPAGTVPVVVVTDGAGYDVSADAMA